MHWRGAAAVVVVLLCCGSVVTPLGASQDPGVATGEADARSDANERIADRLQSGAPYGPAPVATDSPYQPNEAAERGETAALQARTPWGTGPVVVAVEAGAAGNRSVRPLVARAVDYWNRNAPRYGDYAAQFRLTKNASEADVVVRFREEVPCQGETGWLGCAPVYDATSDAAAPSYVDVRAGYTDESTVTTLKHEFGHLLGLTHGEAPRPVMNASHDAVRLPAPNVSERANPWPDRNVTVYVDDEGEPEPRQDAIATQVARTLDYYESGANGTTPPNVSFETVENRSEADVVVSFPSDPTCRTGAGSCGRTYGRDVDADGRLEHYTRSRIEISGVPTDAVGWHLGYWLGSALGATDRSELPPPFRTDENRRGAWWA